MDILEKIVANKKQEVANAKQAITINYLQNMPRFSQAVPSLKERFGNGNTTGIIAEFKRRSPSKGLINGTATVESVTTAYAQNNAAAISILTDEVFFGGCLQDMVNGLQPNTPILRKDFVIDEYQLIEAKANGASVVLLIAACLTKESLWSLAQTAKNIGLEVLLEVHNEPELGYVNDSVDFVGVNNRNLKTFEVNVQTSFNLLPLIPKNKWAVAESGIDSVETILSLKQAGYHGFLIGEQFMKQANPALAFATFTKQLNAINHAS